MRRDVDDVMGKGGASAAGSFTDSRGNWTDAFTGAADVVRSWVPTLDDDNRH